MGLMMSILVFSVGVLEALACFEHVRQGYLPLDLGRKRRRLVLDLASGAIRHRETRRSSELQGDAHPLQRTLPSPLEDDNEKDDDELEAIFQSVETGQIHSTQTKVPQDHRFLSIDDIVEESDSYASSEISRTSTPNTIIFNAGQEDSSELGLDFEPCYIPPENYSEYYRLNSNPVVLNVEKVPHTLSNDISYHEKQNANNTKSENDQLVCFSPENHKIESIESKVTINGDFKLISQCSHELRIFEDKNSEISSNNCEISLQPKFNVTTPEHYQIEKQLNCNRDRNETICSGEPSEQNFTPEIGKIFHENNTSDHCMYSDQTNENNFVHNDRTLEINKMCTNNEPNFSNSVIENFNLEVINLKKLEPSDPLQKPKSFCELSSCSSETPKTSTAGIVSVKSVTNTVGESGNKSLNINNLLPDHIVDEKILSEAQDPCLVRTMETEKQQALCQIYNKKEPLIENKDVGVSAIDSNAGHEIVPVMQINTDRIKPEGSIESNDSTLLGSHRPDCQTKTNVSLTEAIIHHQLPDHCDASCNKTVCDTPDKLINNELAESIMKIEVEGNDLIKSVETFKNLDEKIVEDQVQNLPKELSTAGILTSGVSEVEGIQKSIEVVVDKNVNDITQIFINNNTSTNDFNLISRSAIEPDVRTFIMPEKQVPMNKNFTQETEFLNDIKEDNDFTINSKSSDINVLKDKFYEPLVEIQCPVNGINRKNDYDDTNKDIENSVVNNTLEEIKNVDCKSNQELIRHEIYDKENTSAPVKKSVVIQENAMRYSMNDSLSQAEEIVDHTVTKSTEYLDSKNKMTMADEQVYEDRKDDKGENTTGFNEEETLKELLDVKDNLRPIPQKEPAVEKSVQKKGVLRKQETLNMCPFVDDVVVMEGTVPSQKHFRPVGDITSPERAFWLIFSGEYTKAMSKDWHSGHFCCWQCDESLTGQRYVLRDDHPYCIKCYEQVFANTCDECSKVIGIDSKDLSYKDKHWHEACFLCSKCRVSLVDKQFGSKADKIYCGNCYDAQFASRCDGCGQIFRAGTKKMEYKTRQWHEQCFCCCVCKSAIGTKSFIPREQEIYCATCYEEKFATRCVKCNKIITSGGVTYKNEPWHRECFTCTHCSTSLAGQRFTSRDEKPYCADCFGELFAKRCTACCKPITGIGGTRFISFEDRHWHNDCFICASCRSSLVGRGFITDADDILCTECAKQKLM